MEINERSMPEDNDQNFISHLERYKFCLSYSKDKTVVSIACGSGYGEYLLATDGMAKKVIGIDYSKEAIEYAKENYKSNNLLFFQRDALDNRLDDLAADLIISLETIEHIKQDKKLLKEFFRILKPGGILILSTPNKAFSYRNLFSIKPINNYHIREYRRKKIFKLLSGHFENIEFFGQKIIFKKSLFNLPKYLFYKLNGGLKKNEKEEYGVVSYPKNDNLETCQFIVVCNKKIVNNREYNKEYFFRTFSNKGLDKNRLKFEQKRIALIRKHSHTLGGKILDVGCGLGFFLKVCDELSFDTYGIDGSEYAISQAKNITKAKLSASDLSKKDFPFADNFFDIVTSFDVLEHLENDEIFFREIKRVLKKNGIAIISTPDGKSEQDKELTHINIYKKEDLINKLKAADFKILDVQEGRGYTHRIVPLRRYSFMNKINQRLCDLFGRYVREVAMTAKK